jgi:hypothetical protein
MLQRLSVGDGSSDAVRGLYLTHDGVLILGHHDSAASVQLAPEPLLPRLAAIARGRNVVNA